MCERDMMYGGYYQNIPGNMAYGNFGFQGMPGSLMGTNIIPNMMSNYQNPNFSNLNSLNNDNTIDIITRLNNLETRIRLIEQRLGNNNSYQDDNSMYMI